MTRLPRAGLAVAASLAVLAAAPIPVAGADTPTCDGKAATIVTSTGHVFGTDGDDVIVATGDYPEVDSGAGDDTVCFLSLSATVQTGSGDDLVDTTQVPADSATHNHLGPGSDVFLGGPAEDYVEVGRHAGHDVISTGDNSDYVRLRSGSSDVSTGSGNDSVFLEPGHLDGGALHLGRDQGLNLDKLYVYTRSSTVDADELHHTLVVGDAHYRFAGAEVLTASGRTVRLLGDQHANTMHVYGCRVTLGGRGGSDRLFLEPGPTAGFDGVKVDCGSVNGHLYGGAGKDLLSASSGRRDVLVGGAGFDTAYGGGHGTCEAERTSGCR